MDQKKLHKTIESIASQKFDSEEEMLKYVLEQIINDKSFEITGGRIWKLEPETYSYKLLYQTGKMEKIDPRFRIRLKNYPEFERIANERTILADETLTELKKKGIFRYSATGVGSRIKLNGKIYYEYILALNSNSLDEEFRLNMSIIATALTSQIRQRRILASATNLKADLDKARQLQKSILPEHEYKFHNYDIFGLTDPAEIVGGDFFDYLEIGDDQDRLGIAVGDAASKGVSAAAEAMYISGALRMASNFEIKITPLMKRMNQLVNKIFEDDKFSSLFYGELSTDKNGLFLYTNAGHNPPLFYSSRKNKVEYLLVTGPVLGPVPHAKYQIESINFFPGDILLMFSDGIVESTNSKGEPYPEVRLINLLKNNKSKTPKEIALRILDDVIRFTKNGTYSDDKTLVVIKRNE
ncbi:MAG: serine/threonine-protein phosphatase [Ignavibacterium album]|uniref:PP2C family protein-serine/threonine phosphatase n=1 Tax=Ignavibacterium album TaxID=591197 RepID=UPI0026F129A1|nr:PP2C family protein-serine/threonine phosphatase [Ignavibacterium album]MCX8104726.1 serine/threonine-protein phosphatase [Ignavibacterium album]